MKTQRAALSRLCIVVVTLVLLHVPHPAAAYFERFVASTRTFSLGGAFVALADDPSATVSNAAGLAQLNTVGLMTTVNRPYGLNDVEESFLAVAVPLKYVSLGVSWHHLGLSGVTSEDQFTLAAGYDLIRTTQDASLSIGATLDVVRVAYQSGFNESQTKLTGSVGILLRPFPVIGLGYTIRNLGQPHFGFVSGDGGTSLKTTQNIGLAYHWRRRFTFVLETAQRQDRSWQNRVGFEVEAMKGLRMRAGLTALDITGGIGLTVSRVDLDIGAASHDVLGLSYHLSLGVRIGGPSGEVP